MSRDSALMLPDLPRHNEAEQSVLGGILVEPSRLYDVAGKVQADHFHHPFHRHIYAAIEKLARERKPIDVLSVHSALATPDIPMAYVDKLTEGVPRRTNVEYYAGLVLNAAKLRAAVLRAADVIQAATAPQATASEVIEQAQAAYFDLAGDTQRKTLWWADEMTIELSQALDGKSETPSVPPVQIGLPSVDGLFDGFAPGDLAFLAGRPSTGKSALAFQIALNAAESRTVLICSLEMKHTAVWRRALANVTRIQIPTYQRRPFSENQQQHIGRGLAKLGELRLAIEDMPNATEMQILATARRVQMQRGLGLIIVDYLQRMRSADKFDKRGDELGAITGSLKQIAMQLDVPILTLAALSRAAQNERPNMAHIRECGTAEYDADAIFLMHRNVQAQKDLEPGQPSPAELIVEKQRNGATGSIPLLYFGEHYRFESQAVA
jgi:replicative DNA helicase